jgi:predicted 3-demethylubiquinone-9 3-methyltransferase (glyoxalase superfamily)
MAVGFTPCLWYTQDAEAAARFYVSVIPNSSIDVITSLPVDTPSGPAGSSAVVEFTVSGAPVMAFTGGPHHPFNDAISLTLLCDTQAEIDALWDGLLQGGGEPLACGWLRDRYGVSWQITPRRMGVMMADPDRKKAARAATAMMGMVKFDLAALEAAFRG